MRINSAILLNLQKNLLSFETKQDYIPDDQVNKVKNPVKLHSHFFGEM